METKTFKNWWFLSLNGCIAILFGLLLLLFTKEFILTVVVYIGVLILLAGLVLLLVAIYNLKKDRSVALMMVQAIASIAIGLIMMIFREETLKVFLILVGVWAVIVGIFQLVVLVNVKRNLTNKNIILFNGLLTVALGVVLIFKPFGIGDLIGKLIGIFSILFGVLMVYLGFIIRKVTIGNETDNPAKSD
jgi:uncharacterized membrane protein HdeD (DUF308 family)